MNQGQFRDPLCYLWHCGIISVSNARGCGFKYSNSFYFRKKLSLNSGNSVKTFKENSNRNVNFSEYIKYEVLSRDFHVAMKQIKRDVGYVKFKSLLTPNFSTDTPVDTLKECIDFNCIIHTKLKC